MATAQALESLQVEASCSICLDYLSDPVTIDCGHNFCRGCISRCWEELEGHFPCPVCRRRFHLRCFRTNRQLGNVAEIARQLRAKRSQRHRRPRPDASRVLCHKHQQVLSLFCEKDQEAVCLACRISCHHRDHAVGPLDRAALAHKKKLRAYLGPLKRQVEDARKFLSSEQKKPAELREKVESRRQKIASEFERLHQFLQEEQQAVLRRLEDEEKEVLQRLSENAAKLADHSTSLSKLITEIEERCQQPAIDLLKGIKSTLNRCENIKIPKAISIELKKDSCSFPLQHFALKKMIKKFKADVTLDPKTAHPNLILSEDRKSVSCKGGVEWSEEDEFLEDEEDDDSAQAASRESVFPPSQELILMLEPIASPHSQGMLLDHDPGEGTAALHEYKERRDVRDESRQDAMVKLMGEKNDMLHCMVDLMWERQQDHRLPLQPLYNHLPSSPSSIASSPRRSRTRKGEAIGTHPVNPRGLHKQQKNGIS
ncbi:Tripartite motif-containing protein 39 [Chelonia mydas]|uniref:Tripartite motif-containing protein 39 n=1 Tax=Chelonia mydas TaxID=8469 RepID=M7B0H9_CHEMY|nr:Tripartite motif-containing protein 39 [Chelonia mydas]